MGEFRGGLRVKLSERDLEVLEWINAQYAVREDQLARLLGRSMKTAKRWARCRRDEGLCRREQLLRGDPGWVWLTAAGSRLTRSRLRPWRGHIGKLGHIRAVVDLRLYIEAKVPEATWVSERELFSRHAEKLFSRDGHARGDVPHVPDAELVLANGERHALEVELTRKSRHRLDAIITALVSDYDQVVYFCGPRIGETIAAAVSKEDTSRVSIRELGELQRGEADAA
jgi:hypothetical protein